jgi:hypothetical protein
MVVLVDVSSLMGPLDRLAKARTAAKEVIQSMNNAVSFVQAIGFGPLGDVSTAGDGLLMRCNDTGTATVRAFIDTLVVTAQIGVANITGAFQLAMSILDRSREVNRSALCRTAIIVLSPTEDTELEQVVTDGLAAWEHGEGTAPRLFMFTYGDKRSTAEQHKAVSCAHGGVWAPLPDSVKDHTYIATNISAFFAAGIMEDAAIWSQPYLDASGLGVVITATKACRWKLTVPPKLLAVVATDFAISSRPEFTPEKVANLTTLTRCLAFQLNQYDIEQLRGDERCEPSFNTVFVAVSVVIAAAVIIITSLILFISTRIGGGSKVGGGVAMDPANEHAHR